MEYIERTPKARHAHRWKNYLRSLPPPLSDVKSPKTWQTVYSLKAISEALSHVRVLAYKEKVVRNTDLSISEIMAYYSLSFTNSNLIFDHSCVKKSEES